MKKQVIKYTTAALLAVAIILGITFGGYLLSVHYGLTGLKIRTDMPYQTFEGFGASSAWTFQNLGLIEDEEVKEDAIEKLYGDSGLSLDIFRYNIGGGGKYLDCYPDKQRGAESFFDEKKFNGDYSVFADPSNYDFTRDKGVRELFEKALSKGHITEVVFFANSPHYLMTKNGFTHSSKKKENNLKEECYGAFSDYLLVITNWLYDNIVCKYDPDREIKVYISPVNEPQWDWGGEEPSQEGCHYDPEELAQFYDVFSKTLKAFNQSHATSFKMDIFESGNYKLTEKGTKFQAYMKELSQYEYFSELDTISAHSYGADNNLRARNMVFSFLKRSYPDKKLSVSEYCVLEGGVDPSIDMGLYSAKTVINDLNTLNAVKWNWWLGVSTYDYEDGLVYWNPTDNTLSVTNRYYALGQLSRYIEPGSVRVGAEYGDSIGWNGVESLAFIKPDGRLAVVVLNTSPRPHRIRLYGGYGTVTEIVTDAERNWAQSEYEFNNYIEVSPKSITTFIFTGDAPYEDPNGGYFGK